MLTVTDTETTLEGISSEVGIISGTTFSTTDVGPSTNCVVGSDAVPWFDDMFGNQEPDVCSSPAAAALNGSSYRGANAMAYFLR